MRLDHINISAAAALLEEVRDFYSAVFGFVEGPRPTFRSGGCWLYDGDRALVHLSLSDNHEPAPGEGCLDHVAFQASGLQEFRARLESLGIAYRSNVIPELSMTQLFFTDPAGTGLEVNFPGERAT